ncbi:MAG: tetratricopeptide repeat protein [Myxococcales bacterium]|nr:tetratricopeptide repeat protein [Myxococcales bacterium]
MVHWRSHLNSFALPIPALKHWLVTLGCVAAVSAAAITPPNDSGAKTNARARFDEGRALFRSERFEPAAEVFKEAYALFPDPAYLFNIALCYERRGRWRLAVEYYDSFLASAPDSSAAPDVEERRKAARTARDAERGFVNVVTRPVGALVTITSSSGERRCTSPCRERVDPGAVTVVTELPGVAPGAPTRTAARPLGPAEQWDLLLEFPMGQLILEGDADGDVRLGGELVRVGEPIELLAGHHTLTAPGRDARDVHVEEGRTVTIELASWPRATDRGTSAQDIAGWSLVGAGSGALVAGIVLAVLSSSDYDEAEAVAAGPATRAAQDALSGLKDDIASKNLGADVSFGLAGASFTSALILLLLPESESAQ